ncbi:hypothetical protein CMK19_01235 [Candidatus Poribacteria bacterium]|nr:hypothetical protein [Candidatus Poribacteria bacterium]|tara:strand:- start:314 stop:1171 length:858 start_codon:yes stop_codon:yes gene_type:complete
MQNKSVVDNTEAALPTGKSHISFSEVKCWKECSWRHKLLYVDKIDVFEPSPFLDFGTAVHEGCESLLETKTIDREKILKDVTDAWEKHGFDEPEWYEKQPGWYKYAPVEEWCEWATNMWNDVPEFLDKTFPSWETVKAEEELREDIENSDVKFKGFIDAIIKVPKKRGKGFEYWILDWKTAQSYGWKRQKKQDILMTAQLILYKHFWSKKHDIPLKDIRCGFILLKRGAKPGNVCELVKVSAGPKSIDRALKIMRSMIKSVKKQFNLKNRNSCMFCDFKDTEHCT